MRKSRTRRSQLYLAASVALALSAGTIIRSNLARYAAAAANARPDVPVVVAAEPLARGQRLGADQLTVELVPRDFVPPGALSTVEQAAGRVALGDLLRGEPVTQTRLARVRAGPVASLVPEGLRAFAVPTAFPAGAIANGDRVDVLATYGPPEARTETVVSSVEVLFVLGPGGRPASEAILSQADLDAAGLGAGASTTLILLVTPVQEERLAYARAFGTLEVTVVSAEDG